MPYSTDIKDYWRRAWGIGDRKADGGRIGFADGPPKPSFKYIDTGERYIMKQISNITGKIKYVKAFRGEAARFDKLKDAVEARTIQENKLVKKHKLPKDYFKWSSTEKQWFKSPVGKMISRADLIKEIKAGKTIKDIAQGLYNNNKAYFDKLPDKIFSTGKRGFGDYALSKPNEIRNALQAQVSTRYVQRRDPKRLEENKKLQKILAKSNARYNNVIKDIETFIRGNKAKYKKEKYGGAHQLQEAVLDMLEKKYPNLIKVSEGSTVGGGAITKGQRLIPAGIFKGDVIGGDRGQHLNLKRMVYKSLDITFDTKKMGKFTGETRDYQKAIKKLLPIAQEKGILPKTFISPAGNKIKLTAQNYPNYVRHSLTDPLFKIFGNIIKWSPEHPGGMTRAALKGLMDAETLGHVLPMQSFAEEGVHWRNSPNILKGVELDKKLTGLVRGAENVDDATRIKLLKAANKLSKEKGFKYGTKQTMYHWDGKNIVSKYPNLTLQDTMVAKTKAAIHNFIANGGMNKPGFKELPIKLQNAIKAIDGGDFSKGHQLIKTHLQDVIIKPYWKVSSDIRINNFAGAIDLDMVPAGLRNVAAKTIGAFGKVLKVLGPVTVPLDLIPFKQAQDLGIKDAGKVAAKNVAEGYLNLPRTIEDLFHVAGEGTWKDFGSKAEEERLISYEPFEFGQEATLNALRETSEEDIVKNIRNEYKNQYADIHGGQQVADLEYTEESINEKINKALELKKYAHSVPPKEEEEEEEVETVKETENVFGTQIPMKNITEPTPLKDQWLNKGGLSGVDQYILNRYK